MASFFLHTLLRCGGDFGYPHWQVRAFLALSVGSVCPGSVPSAVNECGAGAVAVGFRQTNIVWCAFICCTAMARMVDESAVAPETRSHAPTAALLRWVSLILSLSLSLCFSLCLSVSLCLCLCLCLSLSLPLPPSLPLFKSVAFGFSIVGGMHRYLAGGWSIRGRLLLATLPYLLLAGAFVAFLKVRCLGRCHFSADQEPLLPTRLSLCLSLAVVCWLTSAIRAVLTCTGQRWSCNRRSHCACPCTALPTAYVLRGLHVRAAGAVPAGLWWASWGHGAVVSATSWLLEAFGVYSGCI